MIIQPIVEGPGDVQAVPSLLSRMLEEFIGCPHVRVAPPMKLARGRMVQEDSCKHLLRIANLEASYVMLFLDADDDCCEELHDLIHRWATSEVYRASFDLIGIEREFECWLLAGIESLRGLRGISDSATHPQNPSQVRGAKERITKLMPRGTAYSETVDQAALTRAVDLGQVQDLCPSFARLVRKLMQWHDNNCPSCESARLPS